MPFPAPGVLGMFKFHAEREMQLESLYSTLMMIGSLFGAPVAIMHSHGAWNLSGNLSHAMKILSTILLLGFLAGLGSGHFFDGRATVGRTPIVFPAM